MYLNAVACPVLVPRLSCDASFIDPFLQLFVVIFQFPQIRQRCRRVMSVTIAVYGLFVVGFRAQRSVVLR